MSHVISDRDMPDVLTMFSGYLSAGISAAESARKTGRTFPRYQTTFNELASSFEAGQGLAVSMEKVNLLSKKNCKVIQSGETNGRISSVIRDLVDVQRQLNEFSNEIKKSLASQAITIILSLLVAPYLLVFMSQYTPDESLLKFATLVNSFSEVVPYLPYVYPMVLFIGVLALFQSKSAQMWIISTISIVPYVNRAAVNWQLGHWTSLMALSIKSGLGFRLAEPLVGEVLQPDLRVAIKKICDESVDMGWVAACDRERWKSNDERHLLPEILLTFLMAGADQGTLDIQLAELSAMMTRDAKKSFKTITAVTFYLVLISASAIVLYLSLTVMTARFHSLQGIM
ncbi:type II secretion system F family protein [Vibrio fluvialis]|nr:type II secretion system F family protein [Vibrio fluvialis]